MESEIQSEELKEGGGDGKFSGLAEDEEGRVVTIKEGKSKATELLFFDLKSKRVTRRLGIGHLGEVLRARYRTTFAF